MVQENGKDNDTTPLSGNDFNSSHKQIQLQHHHHHDDHHDHQQHQQQQHHQVSKFENKETANARTYAPRLQTSSSSGSSSSSRARSSQARCPGRAWRVQTQASKFQPPNPNPNPNPNLVLDHRLHSRHSRRRCRRYQGFLNLNQGAVVVAKSLC